MVGPRGAKKPILGGSLIMRALALGLATLALFSIAASAHGPSRQKVVETVDINAPADKVWAVIGNFQDMSWHPAVAKLEGTGGNDANATRTLTLQSGGTIAEKLIQNDAAGTTSMRSPTST
jgi:hypothetical protein